MNPEIMDLRSDTVTLPTAEMRKAMTEAEVGDDVYGEDPTINRLQQLAAQKMGKEAGLFLPSGTMGNLAAVLAHCARGDEVIMGGYGHTFLYEAGGISALGGVFPHTVPNQPDGTLKLEDIRDAIRASGNIHFPPSRLLIMENTQNRCGGVPLSLEYTNAAAGIAHNAGMQVHLDGARIFNAAVALKTSAAELAAPADSITFCLSKGLCAPVGSVLCGKVDFIAKALRVRKLLGGAMRQAGVLAAAGIVALEQMVDRLADDHRRAKALAQGLASIPGLALDPGSPATNMVFISLNAGVNVIPSDIIRQLSEQGIKVGMMSSTTFRLVCHHGITDEGVERTIAAFKKALA